MQMISKLAINDPTWLNFVASHPSATAFHHPAWGGLLAECYGYPSHAFILTDSTGRITAGLPILQVDSPLSRYRRVSLPFTDYCPPLAEGTEALIACTDALVQQRSKDRIASIEIRAPLQKCTGVYTHSDAVIHTLTLSLDSQAVFRTFKRTQVQQCIIRAEREGVTVRRGETVADLDSFYHLHLQTRRRLGTPVQPRRFFELLWKRLLEPGLGFLLLAYKDNIPLAGAIFLAWNGTVIYKYSASDSAYWKLRPNNLILWHAIRWACENGYHTFDFGRTELKDQGLRDFKNGWGTREEPLIYSIIANNMPKPLNGRVSRWMETVIRHSPLWVCSMLGEMFYKYAA